MTKYLGHKNMWKLIQKRWNTHIIIPSGNFFQFTNRKTNEQVDIFYSKNFNDDWLWDRYKKKISGGDNNGRRK